MIRQIIKINSERCDGCGICLTACDEGALQIINGKAVLIKDDYCDGLGNCLPVCPQDAIRFEMREAAEFNESAVEEHLKKNKKITPTPKTPQNYDIYEQFSIPAHENPLSEEILIHLESPQIEVKVPNFSQFTTEEPRVVETLVKDINDQDEHEVHNDKQAKEQDEQKEITPQNSNASEYTPDTPHTPMIFNQETLNPNLETLDSELATLDAELESIDTELSQIDTQIEQEIAHIHEELTTISAPTQLISSTKENIFNPTQTITHKPCAHPIKNIPQNAKRSKKLYGDTALRQWPVQMKLVPTKASYFDDAHLLIAADCTAFAYANFHKKFMRNKAVLIACPKLDNCDYTSKIKDILSTNKIKSVTVVRMEVPCCSRMEQTVIEALKQTLENTGKFLSWQSVVISTKGKIL